MHRRSFLKSGVLGSAGVAAASPLLASSVLAQADQMATGIPASQQSVSYWCYGSMKLEELLPELKKMGLSAIDLIPPSQWSTLKEHGFTCSMAYGREKEDITTGFIDEHLHEELYISYSKMIPQIGEYGYKNMVVFAGNRRGRNDLQGIRTAAKGIKRLMPIAKEHGVTLQLEVFNSKVDHPDYMGDSTQWAVTLCDLVDSDNFKILWDIYHMQVQEGNVIQTIKDYHPYFGHYHTAGVPGRHEIGNNQELYYPAVVKAIKDTGFTGYLAHEFIPTGEDKLQSLRDAIRICG
ncbi:MAG: TIM barrel protein [Saprospiraceae bacterium]